MWCDSKSGNKHAHYSMRKDQYIGLNVYIYSS